MSEIQMVKVSEDVFSIINLDSFTSRKKTKLGIFLDGFSDLEIERDTDVIKLHFTLLDDYSVGQSISTIYNYLTENSDGVCIDDSVKEIIAKYLQENKQTASLKQKMTEAKNKQTGSDFDEFKYFCNEHLSITLRDYQYESAHLLSIGRGGFDFSVPGAGKTIISYAVYIYLLKNNIIDKIFIVGPMNAYNAWYEEYMTCFNKKPDFINLSKESVNDCKNYLRTSNNFHKGINFINYDKLRHLTDDISFFLKNEKILLIVDEVHRAKNPNAAVTSSIISFAPLAKARILLTGTPMPNGYEDLYSLTKILNFNNDILPYTYSKLKDFSEKGATEKEINNVKDSLYPYFSRVSKRHLVERGELKPAIFNPITQIEMDDSQFYLYEKLDNFYGKISDAIDDDLLESLKKAALIRKMQISANPGLLKNSLEKVIMDSYDEQNQACELISEILVADKLLMDAFTSSDILQLVNDYHYRKKVTPKNIEVIKLIKNLLKKGESVLVWDVFVSNIYCLQDLLSEYGICDVEVINGNVSLEDRQVSISNFRKKDSRVLIANPATLAESISLHKVCQNAIYVNRNFNCAQFIQSKDRIHRINMPKGKTANYYFINNVNSVDEIINKRLIIKENRMLEILDNEGLAIGSIDDSGDGITAEDIDAVFGKN